MTRIEANTLEEAYLNAAQELKCSITELDIVVIQNSSSGFLGMFKKIAIIEVRKKGSKKGSKKFDNNVKSTKIRKQRNSKKEKRETSKTSHPNSLENAKKPKNEKKQTKATVKKEERKPLRREIRKQLLKIDINRAISEISTDINRLFRESCFEMDDIKVSKYNDNTILLEFGGEDAALLIGKEGYRYKALSYFLYNWINIKYGANIRLEIAEFLKNQEEMIGKYLVPVIERVRNNGRGQTKTLDGVLIKIALEKLRNEFPEKYVGIKSARSGGRFIVINDFNRKTK